MVYPFIQIRKEVIDRVTYILNIDIMSKQFLDRNQIIKVHQVIRRHPAVAMALLEL